LSDDSDSKKQKLFFTRARLGIVAHEGTVRMLRGDEVIDKQHIKGALSWSVLLPEQKLAIVGWSVSGDYHHGDESEDGVTILRLKPR